MNDRYEFHAISTSTYKDQSYEMIKNAILYRKLKVGEIYSQDSICSELGISRTPVREALLELSKEGYITFLRGRGIMVVPVDPHEADDIIELRTILELSAVELAASRINDTQLDGLVALTKQMREAITEQNSSEELYKTDRAFHKAVCSASGNSWIVKSVENCRDHYLRVETQTAFNDIEGAEMVLNEHEAILEALRARDPEKAAHAMRKHLENSYDRSIN